MNVLEIADLVGIVAFGLGGYLAAVRKELDLLGIALATGATALGGGVIRDILVDRPPLSLTHWLPSLTVIVVIVTAFFTGLHRRPDLERRRLFIISDAIGLASFALSGAIAGVHAGFTLFGVLLLTLITATGGGVIRDTLLNQVPLILTGGFYGSSALLIGLGYYLLSIMGWANYATVTLLFLAGITVRITAHYRNWRLPVIAPHKE